MKGSFTILFRKKKSHNFIYKRYLIPNLLRKNIFINFMKRKIFTNNFWNIF